MIQSQLTTSPFWVVTFTRRGPSIHTNALAHGKPVWMTEHYIDDTQTNMANCIAIAKEIERMHE